MGVNDPVNKSCVPFGQRRLEENIMIYQLKIQYSIDSSVKCATEDSVIGFLVGRKSLSISLHFHTFPPSLPLLN